jgi:glutathionyl-hydroquinone reductase
MASGTYVEDDFQRDTDYIEDRITRDGTGARAWPVEPDRYRLVAARACPWANRAIIVRRLLGLEAIRDLAEHRGVHLGVTHDAATSDAVRSCLELWLHQQHELRIRRGAGQERGRHDAQ